ncbi:hypothetical protein E4U21_000477 [Claviceps maximensis]|nr:hypothetical protein E4U21_000477 [Claviceps maximensis]
MRLFLPITLCISFFCLLTAAATTGPPSAVTLAVKLPNNAINELPIAANGGKFWVGKPTSHYCPPNVDKDGGCPSGDETSIWVSTEFTTCALNVVVPGGQQVYVAPDNSLSFTQPHSAYVPPGSDVMGFRLLKDEFIMPKRRILVCPAPDSPDVYQIFLPLKTSDVTPGPGCVEIQISTNPAKAPVWEFI